MSRYAEAHSSPNGPGDARPTALQIVEDESLNGKLTDKVFLATGVSSGIGIETLRALYATGAHVIGTVRNMEKGKAVVEEIEKNTPSKGEITLVLMDMESLESVRSAAAEIKGLTDKLNVAVFNAGVMATPQGKTKDGFETQFGTNHLAHFLLFNLLKPLLLSSSSQSSGSRVVAVSSMAHRIAPTRPHDWNFTKPDSYQPWVSYGQAKTANVHMANAITRRYGSKGLNGLSLHPGGISTGLQVHLPEETMKQWESNPDMATYMKSPAQGAATSVYAALGKEFEGKGLVYLSNCEVQGLATSQDPLSMTEEGHSAWAFDQDAEDKLWKASLEMVGLGAEE